MTFLEPYSSAGALTAAGLPDEQDRFSDAGIISRAPVEVTHELASLLANLHERVSPNYRPREIILELLAELERKSAFTARHSMRVATVARILAKSLHLDIVAVERISLAALLHDVGKLVIPIRILNKKHALSDAERRCIQTHAVFTDVILSAFPIFDAIRGIATLHHEHLNGTGYPFGYGGSELSMETRMITVADIFVALTEDRPYRPGVTNSAALHKLQTLASEDIVDRRLVESARQHLFPYNHTSAIWFPSRTAISIALDQESVQSAGMIS
jgi:HD-GYP domain-containing protein (c-di-GMP phosphodiesterase class II)